MVSAFFVAKCKSPEILSIMIRVCINKIMEEQAEATPHQPADLETWWQRVTKTFADHFEPTTGICPASKNDFFIDTDPIVMLPHHQLYRMSDSERLEFETQIATCLANGEVTDSQSQFAVPVIFVKKTGSLWTADVHRLHWPKCNHHQRLVHTSIYRRSHSSATQVQGVYHSRLSQCIPLVTHALR